ncbi:MAG: hypothetical protein HFH68_04635 [Lachnospiraceae bacterium]|nr:hypothetical protein [Lachnospiraceae bacterium]
MSKLGKKGSFERGTFMAYACVTCYCYCSTCTNCTGSTLKTNGSSVLKTVTTNTNQGGFNNASLI